MYFSLARSKCGKPLATIAELPAEPGTDCDWFLEDRRRFPIELLRPPSEWLDTTHADGLVFRNTAEGGVRSEIQIEAVALVIAAKARL